MTQFSTQEKLGIAIICFLIIIVTTIGSYTIYKKVDIPVTINTAISNVKTSSTEKKNEISRGIKSIKTQLGDSLSHKEQFSITIFFNSNEATLSEDDNQELKKIIDFYNNHPNSSITILGHTDKAGGSNINIPLSIARTESVKQYLLHKGISNIKPIGYGDTSDSRSVNIIITDE